MPLVPPFPDAPSDPTAPQSQPSPHQSGGQHDAQKVEQRPLELPCAKASRQDPPGKARSDQDAQGEARQRTQVGNDRTPGIVELRQKLLLSSPERAQKTRDDRVAPLSERYTHSIHRGPSRRRSSLGEPRRLTGVRIGDLLLSRHSARGRSGLQLNQVLRRKGKWHSTGSR